MRNTITILLVGLLIGGIVGFLISDWSSYDTTKALQRRAFLGGMIVFCADVQDASGTKIFTPSDCDGFAKQYLSSDLFEQWYQLPALTAQP